jgi:hypothetical protein
MPLSWVEHRGHRILYVDYSGLGKVECLALLREHAAALDASQGLVLTLVNARGAVLGSEFLHAASAAAPRNTRRTLRRAIVGVEGFALEMLEFFNLKTGPAQMKAFETFDEALAYLTGP